MPPGEQSSSAYPYAPPGADAREAGIRARLAEISGGAPTGPEAGLLARLLVSYTAKTPPALAHLEALLRGGDVTAVQHHAHALKGSASNLGITALAALLAGIEQHARAGQLPDPAETLSAVRREYAAVEPVCARVAADLGGAG